MCIWFHTITMEVVNAWLLYRKQRPGEKSMKLWDFQADVAHAFVKSGKGKMRGRPCPYTAHSPSPVPRKRKTLAPAKDVRLDVFDHMPA